MSDNRKLLKVQKIKESQAKNQKNGINEIIFKDNNGVTYSWDTKSKIITDYKIGAWLEIIADVNQWKNDDGYFNIRNVYMGYNKNKTYSVTYSYKY